MKKTIKKIVSRKTKVDEPVEEQPKLAQKQTKKIITKKTTDKTSVVTDKAASKKLIPFKGLLALPNGLIKEITNEKQFNKLVQVAEFKNNALNFTRPLITAIKTCNFNGLWRINSNSIHFTQNKYNETTQASREEKEKFIREFDTTKLKPAFKKIKKYIIKWDFYDTCLSSVISHDYRETNRESTKDKSWSAIGLDIVFKNSDFAEIFIRQAINSGIKIKGYSDIIIPKEK